jgi:hypothetical protein
MTVLSTRVTFDHVRNTAAGFAAANPVLGYGVTGVETDTGRQKVGDGVTAWSTLTYADAAAIQRANHTGTQAISTVSGLQAALDAKATPADVSSAVSGLVNAAPAALDTLQELAAALGNDASFSATVTNALAAKAPLASPTFTGTVSGVTKAMVGLGNVDNTADAAKPVSTAMQTALDGKVATTDSRLTDSREWSASTVSQADAEAGTSTSRFAFTPLRVFQAVAAWWAASSAKTKLDGIASGATANATDAQLRDRSTHTGTQAAGTITGLAAVATSGAYSSLTGTPSTLPPTDGSVTDAKIVSTGLSTSSLNWAAIQPWAANTAYAKGDLVSNAGIAYRRSAAGTSGATFNTANWQQITPTDFVASQIASGTIATARLGSGTASSSTFLRGDQTYAEPPVTSVNGSTGAVTLPAFYEFTRTSKPAAATGSNGSYTWTVPTGARFILMEIIGAGGGGGSGRRGAATTARGGGGGGGGGGRIRTGWVAVSQLESSTLSITVGAGGGGGAAITANDTSGANGTTGGDSVVNTSSSFFQWIAAGGGPGFGGTTAAGSGGASPQAGSQPRSDYAWGGSGGAGGATASPPNGFDGANSGWTASGGGGGGGVNASDVIGAGGSSGWSNRPEYINSAQVTIANSSAGTNGRSGWNGSGTMGSSGQIVGISGSGGNASTTTAAGSGGAGVGFGAAGGGGGASLNGFNSGAGGNGSEGYIRIMVI